MTKLRGEAPTLSNLDMKNLLSYQKILTNQIARIQLSDKFAGANAEKIKLKSPKKFFYKIGAETNRSSNSLEKKFSPTGQHINLDLK